MANLEIKESKRNKDIHNNCNLTVKSGLMNGPEIFDTLQAISPKNKVRRSFE